MTFMAEDEGTFGRCPRCRRRIWVESGCLAECQACGWTDEDNRPKDDDDELVKVCRNILLSALNHN